MKQSTEGAKHFSEIVNIARQMTTEIKGIHYRRLAIRRLTNELLNYQINKPVIIVKIY